MHRYAKLCSGAVTGCGVLAVLMVLPASAGSRSNKEGGALSRATSAVRQSAGAPSRPSGGTSAPSTSPSDGGWHSHTYYPDYTTPRPCYGCAAGMPGPPPSASPPRGPQPELALDLGLQSVEDSDRAAAGALRVTVGPLGVNLAGTRYYEDGRALDGSNTITMSVWAVTGLVRAAHHPGTELWLSGGLGGASSTEFESIMGPTLGAMLEHTLTPTLEARGGVRVFVLESGVRASELRASLGASFLEVGYRVFRFNQGPPLHGPEAGLSLRF